MKRTKENDGSRRYPEDKFPVYHSTYDNKMNRSSVLGQTSGFITGGIGECKGTLYELVGNADGHYKREGNWYQALIPSAKKQLKIVLVKFRHWQKQQVRSGKALKPPKNWPKDLLNERLKAEALLDVRYKEKAKVEARIKQLESQKKKEHQQQVLPHGPISPSGTDGQKVSYSPDGIPFIDEPENSPYDGMTLFHYNKMKKQWRKDIGIDGNKPFDLMGLYEKRDEFYEQARAEATKAGKEPPVKRLVVTHGKVPLWMKRLGITKADWPEWPEDAKPIDEIEEDAVLDS